MKLFVIHRFSDRKQAKSRLKDIARRLSIKFQLILLNSSGGDQWKSEALSSIEQAEAIVIFNKASCEKSENAKWEIEKAEESGKEIIEIDAKGGDQKPTGKLKLLYDLKVEFDACFSPENKESLELYKIMLESSESLIQRRQKTNAFFITVIGGLLAIAGLILKMGAVNNGNYEILYGFSAVALLLCNSWRNLIGNYGKLNKAKFDVILRIEKDLCAQIYAAEWVALGKGLRPNKYKSFTSTEQNVPLYFGLLIIVLTLVGVAIQIWS